MTDIQKKALDKIMEAVPLMSDFEKGRLYGRAEAMEEESNQKKAQEQECAPAGN